MLLRVLYPVRLHATMAHIITAVKGSQIDRSGLPSRSLQSDAAFLPRLRPFRCRAGSKSRPRCFR